MTMHYLYQIKSLADYHIQYKKSVEQPEQFWAEVAANFTWRKNWDKGNMAKYI